MKPYPLAPLNHFTVPFSLTEVLLSSLLNDLSGSFARLCASKIPPQRTRTICIRLCFATRGLPQKQLAPEPSGKTTSGGGPRATLKARISTTLHNPSAQPETQCPNPRALSKRYYSGK